jgi:hypothetical protein
VAAGPEPASRAAGNGPSGEAKARNGDHPSKQPKKDPAPEAGRPNAEGPPPSAISEIPDWVPLVGGFGALPAEAVARGGVKLWQKTRVAASALGAAPLGVLLLGAGLHRARRRRPTPWTQEPEPPSEPRLD